MPPVGMGPKRAAVATVSEHCEGSTTNTIAEATIEEWQRVGARLAPVIGARGVDVLFSRALQQTASSFTWLVMSNKHESSDAFFSGLKMRLASQEAAIAAEASLALRLAFTALLGSLIGLSLTQRLLDPIWGSAVAGV